MKAWTRLFERTVQSLTVGLVGMIVPLASQTFGDECHRSVEGELIPVSVKALSFPPPGEPADIFGSADEIRCAFDTANEILERLGGVAWRLWAYEVIDLEGAVETAPSVSAALADPDLYQWRDDAVNVYVVQDLGGPVGQADFPPAGLGRIVLSQETNRTEAVSEAIDILHEFGHFLSLSHAGLPAFHACAILCESTSCTPPPETVGDCTPAAAEPCGCDIWGLVDPENIMHSSSMVVPAGRGLEGHEALANFTSEQIVHMSYEALNPSAFRSQYARNWTRWRRGDCNDDGSVNITDAVYLLGFLFGETNNPMCLDACDADDGGTLNVSDVALIIQGAVLPAPFHDCGDDSAGDGLLCEEYNSCP